MSNNKLFVRNLPYKLAESELQSMFEEYGTVVSTAIPKDRDTGRPRGFAFVEMSSQDEAEAAIRGLNMRQVGGREMMVAISEPKASGGGGRSGGGYGGGGGYRGR